MKFDLNGNIIWEKIYDTESHHCSYIINVKGGFYCEPNSYLKSLFIIDDNFFNIVRIGELFKYVSIFGIDSDGNTLKCPLSRPSKASITDSDAASFLLNPIDFISIIPVSIENHEAFAVAKVVDASSIQQRLEVIDICSILKSGAQKYKKSNGWKGRLAKRLKD